MLNNHPYHVDSMLQLSEVCRMNEDAQMASELIGKSSCFLLVKSNLLAIRYNISLGKVAIKTDDSNSYSCRDPCNNNTLKPTVN